jgi:hypothetical protein
MSTRLGSILTVVSQLHRDVDSWFYRSAPSREWARVICDLGGGRDHAISVLFDEMGSQQTGPSRERIVEANTRGKSNVVKIAASTLTA